MYRQFGSEQILYGRTVRCGCGCRQITGRLGTIRVYCARTTTGTRYYVLIRVCVCVCAREFSVLCVFGSRASLFWWIVVWFVAVDGDGELVVVFFPTILAIQLCCQLPNAVMIIPNVCIYVYKRAVRISLLYLPEVTRV